MVPAGYVAAAAPHALSSEVVYMYVVGENSRVQIRSRSHEPESHGESSCCRC